MRAEWNLSLKLALVSLKINPRLVVNPILAARRHIQRILNPTVAIETALEVCRASEGGFGPQKLATLAAYALRLGLLGWLHDAQVRSSRAQATP